MNNHLLQPTRNLCQQAAMKQTDFAVSPTVLTYNLSRVCH